MGVFKVGRGPGGRRNMTQVATREEEELQRAEKAPKERGEKDVKYEKRKARDMTGFAGSAAYKTLANGLHKQPMAWAKKFIAKLTDPEEVKRLVALEQDHPKTKGGRKGILMELAAKKKFLDGAPVEGAGEFKKPEAQKEEGDADFSCTFPGCEFKGGSVEGLEGHVLAVHDL